ncbi:MAG: hydroxymethylglutaryl-CoA synthase [Pseudomonadota bacterium]|nr:hydroxymethylglutaryl-CoA synthase [Pseudomonadota bacterium]
MNKPLVGISGFSVYAPPFRIDLEDWCKWNGADRNKIRSIVGSGFRLPGVEHNTYTMASNTILNLIQEFDIDPSEIHYLALGTESSSDNSAGAIIAKGMVDKALKDQGKSPISRNCEVPEFKHACLGGVYALKGAIRFLNNDGANSKAIVVCSDFAIYKKGSSGEPTQGAGAIAILLERNPKIAAIDLEESGSASSYRGVDFRKPIQFLKNDSNSKKLDHAPVFNGRYSAACYIDEMLYALENMYMRRKIQDSEYFNNLAAVFMHRPFRRMAENALGVAYLFDLNSISSGNENQLSLLCENASINLDDLLLEINNRPDLTAFGVREKIRKEAFPLLTQVLRLLREQNNYDQIIGSKILLGQKYMDELGNLYTGALFAWLASGLEEAAENKYDLMGEILLIGYGSGDAAEAIPIHLVDGWQKAAARTKMNNVMKNPINLSEDQYLALRNYEEGLDLNYEPNQEFVIDRIGSENQDDFEDNGIEYYRFIN